MSFDLLAPHYRWLEALCAGELLQRCRVAHLEELPTPSTVLIYGEGNGRFLSAFAERFPLADITVVDASKAMLDRAKQRLINRGLPIERIHFVHADALTWVPPTSAFDLIVTHFFLDCFRADHLQQLIPTIAQAAQPLAQWLLADFKIAEAGIWRLRSRLILALLYAFFRCLTRLPARSLTPPDALLLAAGFSLRQRRDMDAGLLHSDWWTRPALCT